MYSPRRNTGRWRRRGERKSWVILTWGSWVWFRIRRSCWRRRWRRFWFSNRWARRHKLSKNWSLMNCYSNKKHDDPNNFYLHNSSCCFKFCNFTKKPYWILKFYFHIFEQLTIDQNCCLDRVNWKRIPNNILVIKS